jgi:hypothetical protein
VVGWWRVSRGSVGKKLGTKLGGGEIRDLIVVYHSLTGGADDDGESEIT